MKRDKSIFVVLLFTILFGFNAVKAYALSVLAVPQSAYIVQNNEIYDSTGNKIQLRGVNWFGFETQNYVVHGLWSRGYKEMIRQIKSTGFNAVRLPVCPLTLSGVTPTGIDYSKNADLQGLNSLLVLDKVIEELNANGIYILLDHHRPDCNAISELWYTNTYSEQQWLNDLVFLAKRYASLTNFIGIDIKNEPHGQATWGSGNFNTDWNKAAERAANIIIAANANILIFVEGVQDNPLCSGSANHWWGGNLEPMNCYPLQIDSAKLVLSPHVYGPDVYNQPYFNVSDFPQNMPAIWSQHFGFLKDKGYVLAIGEFGGKYGEGDPKDVPWQNGFVDYLIKTGIKNSFYWSWNPNSGDTGGILKDDWQTVRMDKINLLQRLWSGNAVAANSPPQLTQIGNQSVIEGQKLSFTVAAYDADNDPLTFSVENLPSGAEFDATTGGLTWIPTSSQAGTYAVKFTVSDGKSTASESVQITVNNLPSLPVPPPACSDSIDNDNDGLTDYPADPGCSSIGDIDEYNAPDTSTHELPAQINISSDWGAGYCANVTVINNQAGPVNWTTNFEMHDAIYNFWSAQYVIRYSKLSAVGLAWNSNLAPGVSTTFGFCANRTAAANTGNDSATNGTTISVPATENNLATSVTTTSDWETGYCASVDVKNLSSTPVDWKVSFNTPGVINNLWSAAYTQQANTVIAEGLPWDNILNPNDKVSFGFCAQK